MLNDSYEGVRPTKGERFSSGMNELLEESHLCDLDEHQGNCNQQVAA
jgi:hypothetical protein